MMGEPGVALRNANVADCPILIDLLRRSWLRTWAPELPFAAVRLFVEQDPVTAYVHTEWSDFTVAVRAEVIVGMVHVVAERIESIEVDPRLLRSGIGTVLLAHAEDHIRWKYDVARLEVRAFNWAALAFYDYHGWTESSRYDAVECGSLVETIALSKILNAPEQAEVQA